MEEGLIKGACDDAGRRKRRSEPLFSDTTTPPSLFLRCFCLLGSLESAVAADASRLGPGAAGGVVAALGVGLKGAAVVADLGVASDLGISRRGVGLVGAPAVVPVAVRHFFRVFVFSKEFFRSLFLP